MPDVLLATCQRLPAGDEDGTQLIAELARLGVRGRWVSWSSWSSAVTGDADDLVVLRSTWDYSLHRAEFLAWVRGLRRVANAADVVEWNTDKRYLADLAAAGVPIVPTEFALPGERIVLPDAAGIVVKPSVGAGARGTGRFGRDDTDAARRHAGVLHGAGRTVLAQPYLGDVERSGETALIYIDGRFSHAVRKGAMLPAGFTHAVDGAALRIDKNISPRLPQPAELEVGAAVCQAIRDRFGADQLHARVDLLPSPVGPVVGEVELTEPSLFLGYGGEGGDRSAAAGFAAAIAARA